MISLDRGLLGAAGSGDVAERHKKYASLAGALDIIVFASPKYSQLTLAPNLRVFPTRSSKFAHFHRAAELTKKLLKENQYDLLVTQEFTAPAGLKIKKFLDIPWIINIHSMFFSTQWLGFNLIYWYLFFLMKKSIRSADGFRVTNDAIRKKLTDWGIAKPILVQPTPVNIEKFKIESGKFKVENQNPIVLYVGRLEPEKNVSLLIRAFKKLKDEAQLQIVGKGSQEKELRRLAADDLRVEFFGAKSSDELPEIYRSADIFVLPSNSESFGKVLIEAGAAGCALVATETAGAKSILENDEAGILVPVGDTAALTRVLQNLVGKKFEREYWGQRAREISKKYNAETATQRIIDLWKEVAAK
ncbi:MAG: hypothetical protein A2751_03015 [Candidatus Doudnabacteria bacterium RIFCSPHIGHO2_01_FULL_46_14]|uniref:Glycosyl transferase family 1 domain-containing protein n=1 Tax=Candidatus Doudnabacteria bacterium RIFCSPHIGHO2_01_FULL_46_14 TaxID=1817824 RepID=A0A1F5NKG5_9BACT|nr:MAG: hypothetical protein A2751_03015 [Candidatus Doudnabacteria bacterium RIFCSPHIGHO2_01_FULL_46_14]